MICIANNQRNSLERIEHYKTMIDYYNGNDQKAVVLFLNQLVPDNEVEDPVTLLEV